MAGVAVSGTFLMVIGILNLVVLIGIIAVFRRMCAGSSTSTRWNSTSTAADS